VCHLQKPPEPYVVALDSLPRVTTGAHQDHQDLQNVEPKLLHHPLLSTWRWNIADHKDASRPSSPLKVEHHHQSLNSSRLGVLGTNQCHQENPDAEPHPFCLFPMLENY
jgi:hypothetical protein